MAPVFERAKQRGELGNETDLDVFFAPAAGALCARTIVMAKPIDAEWVKSIVDQLLG